MDVREVMRLRPTILIGSVPFAAETVQKILAEPVAFLAINPRSLADIYNDDSDFGAGGGARAGGRAFDTENASRICRGGASCSDTWRLAAARARLLRGLA